jgi:hypothetical protein
MMHIPKTAIPGLRNEDGIHGIPLDRVLNIAKKTTTCAFLPHFLGHGVANVTYSDVDADFMLQPYKPVEQNSNETPNPHVQYSKWFQDFWAEFNRPFAPLQSYHDNLGFFHRLTEIATNALAQRHSLNYPSIARYTLQDCCTRLVYFNDGSRVYMLTAKVVKILIERADRSAARKSTSRGKSVLDEHTFRRKFQQGAAPIWNGSSGQDDYERSRHIQPKSRAESLQGVPVRQLHPSQSRNHAVAVKEGRPGDPLKTHPGATSKACK